MDKATHPKPSGPGDEDPLDLFEAEEASADAPPADDRVESLSAAAPIATQPFAPQTFPAETFGTRSGAHDRVAPVGPRGAEPAYAPAMRRSLPPVMPRPRSTPTAWLQRNALSVAAVLVACLGSAAIVIGMRHRTDTEFDGWARREAQAPATLPSRPDTSAATSIESNQPRAVGDGDELTAAARPRTDGLTGATGTTAVGDDRAALEATRQAALAREASAREAARIAALATPPAAPVRTPANTGTPSASPAPPVTPFPTPGRQGTAPLATGAPTGTNANTAALTTPPASTPPVSVAGMSPLDTPATSSRTATDTVTPPPVISSPVVLPDPTPVIPAAPAASTPVTSSQVTSVPPAATPAPAAIVPPAAPTQNERRASIQGVVNRYRDAYNSLNAQAAKSVWPSVNEKQLGDAFARLERQEFKFAPCSIFFESAGVARATCNGSVSYVPRGGDKRVRTEERRWEFTLKESNREWSIDRVEAR